MSYRLVLSLIVLLSGGCANALDQTNLNAVIEDCPDRPNCVSTRASKDERLIASPELQLPTAEAWPMIIDIIAALPRTTLTKQDTFYLHAECKSRLFGFIDDLQLQINPDSKQLQIRSASRVGYSDMGVNRRRAEQIISQLKSQGIVK